MRSRGRPHETDIPPAEPEATTKARLPGQNADQDRSARAGTSSSQRAQTSRGDDPEEIGGTARGRHRFPRSARIRRQSEIRALYRQGKRRQTDHLDVFVAASPFLRMRLALVVPKHGHKIVERNRLKRRLRESARLELLPLCRDQNATLDVLIRARAPAYGADFGQLREEIRRLAEQLCLHGSS